MSKWTIFMRQTPFVTLLFLTLALATLPGCLRGKYQTRVRYDRATDSFETLVVFEDLWGEKDVDREHLVKTWKMRDDLMILPIPGFPWGGPYTLLRKDDGTLYGVSLHDGGTDPIFLTRADLPLSQVKISPGRLIVSDEGRLGYWQSLSCSGKFLDAAIARIIQR